MSTAEIKVALFSPASNEFTASFSQANTVRKNVISKNVLSIKNKFTC